MSRLPDHLPDNRSLGERAADTAAAAAGSWRFIWAYIALTVLWCAGNVVLWTFDRYPYQAYTFAVSVLAILMSSLILLAGNRQATIDRAHAERSFAHTDELLDLQHQQMLILQDQSATMIAQHSDIIARLDGRTD